VLLRHVERGSRASSGRTEHDRRDCTPVQTDWEDVPWPVDS
jgi:hypothetical protein